MRALPNMTVCCPGDPLEARNLIKYSFIQEGPMYIRLGKNNEPLIHKQQSIIEFGKASILRDGKEFAILSMGNMLETVNKWVSEWEIEGHDPLFASLHTVKPLDVDFLNHIMELRIPIITVEEHNVIGGSYNFV